ncbi:hypothetical protein PAXRUDRAFT_13846 [Paxillus rubicundulus Ve08.2h10]|uniref:Secreted protein n=1 Tax=Paxillus rubicundulus Ve08.2h10 TaxID=930991 RepID=A0A0D0D490_9AGAM|nr:hypothetical protein PAXRUDRAFT_13846 [Paxillus rubicundulus Ve08.2h10]
MSAVVVLVLNFHTSSGTPRKSPSRQVHIAGGLSNVRQTKLNMSNANSDKCNCTATRVSPLPLVPTPFTEVGVHLLAALAPSTPAPANKEIGGASRHLDRLSVWIP